VTLSVLVANSFFFGEGFIFDFEELLVTVIHREEGIVETTRSVLRLPYTAFARTTEQLFACLNATQLKGPVSPMTTLRLTCALTLLGLCDLACCHSAFRVRARFSEELDGRHVL
jgi:hypothetical protein